MTDPHPEGLGVSTCIQLALKDAKIERDEVRCCCCGMGRAVGQG